MAKAKPAGNRKTARAKAKQEPAAPSTELSAELYRRMLDSVNDYAIITLDPEGRVTSWNKTAERIKGYRAEEILGAHFSRFYPPEDVERGKAATELRVAAAEGR